MPQYSNHILYPHEQQTASRQQSVARYGPVWGLRDIVTTEPGDVFQHGPGLEYHLEYVQDHLGELGVHTAQNYEPSLDRRTALKPEYEGLELSVYSFDAEWHAIRPNRRRLLATEIMGDKNHLFRQLASVGLSKLMPRTIPVEPGEKPDIDDDIYEAWLKAGLSSNNEDNYKVHNEEELRAQTPKVEPRYIIQQHIEPAAPLSAQYYAYRKEGRIEWELKAVTETVTAENGAHGGNIYPAEFDPSRITNMIAQEAVRLGFIGHFGIDAIMDKSGRFYAHDFNARPTAATYPMILAERLGEDSWESYVMRTSITELGDLNLHDLKYTKANRVGAVIMSTAQMDELGNIEVMLVGPSEERQELKADLEEALNPGRTMTLRSQPAVVAA